MKVIQDRVFVVVLNATRVKFCTFHGDFSSSCSVKEKR
jgi:hypothetical protein